MRRQNVLILGVLLGALIFYGGFRFFAQDEEDRIRKLIHATEFALERGDAQGVSSFLSESYRDQYGYDKKALLAKIVGFLKPFVSVKVKIKQLKIEVEEEAAEATIGGFLYFRKPQDEKIYYDSIKLKLFLRHEPEGWRLTEAEVISTNELLLFGNVV